MAEQKGPFLFGQGTEVNKNSTSYISVVSPQKKKKEEKERKEKKRKGLGPDCMMWSRAYCFKVTVHQILAE